MFSGVRRLIGSIKVVEEKGMIHISGLPADVVKRDIYKIWSTSRITDYMFSTHRDSSLSFHSFFAPDFVYVLESILNRKVKHGDKFSFHYRALKQVVEMVMEHTWMKETTYPHPDILDFSQIKKLKKTPLDGQMAFLMSYNDIVPKYRLKGYMLAADPGTGKTIAGLLFAACLKSDINIYIVPKNSIDLVWRKTFNDELVTPERTWYSVDGKDLTTGYKNYVFHYEQLDRALAFFKGKVYQKPMIWLDESHNLNEMDSERSKLFVQLAQALSCRHVVWASGTPIKAVGKEIVPFLDTIDSFFTSEVRERFLLIFGKNSARAIDILANRLGYTMIKVAKTDMGIPDLLPPVEVKIQIPNAYDYTLDAVRERMRDFILERMNYYESNMKKYVLFYNHCLDIFSKHLSASQRKDFATYKNYVEMIRAGYDPSSMKEMVKFCNHYELKVIIPTLPQPLRNDFKDARSVVKYYYLKVQGEALGRILGQLRTQCHIDMIPAMGLPDLIDHAKKKTIIFTSYVDVVKVCGEYLTKEGYKPILVYGETNKDLASMIERFAKHVDLNPVIATYDSLSTAVPMVMANNLIMINAPFRDHERKQAIARSWRKDQDTEVSVWDIMLDTGTETNISTRNIDILNWSREQVSAIMNKPIDGTLEIATECFQEPIHRLDLQAIYQSHPVW